MPEPLLEIKDVHMHFVIADSMVRRARHVPAEVLRAVDGVDLEIMPGEALGLVGESGCGKSTLGRCIVGLHAPTAGEIRYAGEPLAAKRKRSERRRIQMVFQDPYSSLNPAHDRPPDALRAPARAQDGAAERHRRPLPGAA